ncbi:MAG TPA: hypothetical protein VK427_23335, partial [Kofleriaceae bacterium]|nr:hypothetical protein [Kofleriaceae bacterium]
MRETILERRQPQLRWSAVLGGAALAIGLWLTLQTLGMGLGLAAVDPDDAGTLKGAGIGTGIYSLIAPLIAMFLGAWLAGRLSGTRDRGVGAMHGGVMWALALALGLYMLMSLAGSIVGNAVRVGGAAANAGAEVASRAGASLDTRDAMSALGVDTNDLLGPINQRLARDGKPAVTANQLNATVRAIAQRGLKQGKLDREVLVDELARNTALSRTDAQEIAAEFGDRYEQLAARAGQFGDDAKRTALDVADNTGKALLIGGLM